MYIILHGRGQAELPTHLRHIDLGQFLKGLIHNVNGWQKQTVYIHYQ